ncbi:MAG TPA: sigma 54-interacting transcriptional regulator [Thermotogota bacterium]|nr:sigma 54-interacting transcriptional regulator [Thermotogota bacterium]HPJ88562.1 sigma 54-interacting transcriptional regulator [Thermotogota bacterium]HPR96713.1 sigma 54-interacting transcriptional regulator [Thermotogota bacterium]
MSQSIIDEMIKRVLYSIKEGVIIINPNKTVVFINKSALDILELEEEHVIGKDVKNAIPNTRLHIVLQTAMPEYDRVHYLKNTTIVTSRIPLFDIGGNIIGVAAIFRDITYIQTMAEAVTSLKRDQKTLKAIINSTSDAISVADENGKIIMVNSEYTRITGLTAEEVEGKPATIDIADKDESKHMLVVKTKKPVFGRRMIVGRTKKEVIVDVTPLYIKEDFKGSVAVIHDVTDISNLMEELADARSLLRKSTSSFTFKDITGKSEKLRIALEQSKRVSATNASVLLRGETGTGKERFAQAIHNSSSRAEGPFIVAKCASIDQKNLTGEIFGIYDYNDYSPVSRHSGLIEEARNGTLFLDEISILDKSTQAKLLQFIQTKRYTAFASSEEKECDVRIIAATSSNLEKLVEENQFLRELYLKLNIVPIFLPPLRERKEDLYALVYSIIMNLNQEYRRDIKKVNDSVFELFRQYKWPGNIRELENALGRALIKAQPFIQELTLEHFDFLMPNMKESENRRGGYRGKLKDIIAKVEKETIEKTLFRNQGNRAKTADELGLSLRALYYKLERYEIGIKSRG